MTARTQSLALLLFAAALLRLATTSALLGYVRPTARAWVLLAAFAILGLTLWNLLAPSASAHDPGGFGKPAPSLGTGEHRHRAGGCVSWLVLAPVIAILAVSPPALGVYSAARVDPVVARPSNRHFPTLSGPDPVTVQLSAYATRALWDEGRTLSGRRVRLTGFVLADSRDGFILSRLVISCCAAASCTTSLKEAQFLLVQIELHSKGIHLSLMLVAQLSHLGFVHFPLSQHADLGITDRPEVLE